MRSIVTDVPWCPVICLLDTFVGPANTAELIEMPFGIWTHLCPAPLIWDQLLLITDPVPHNWDPTPFCWDPPLCLVESKHQTLLTCHKSQTECLECSKTTGRQSGTPPLLSALRARASALQASRLQGSITSCWVILLLGVPLKPLGPGFPWEGALL